MFDIGLLTERLVDATDWLRRQPGVAPASVGYLGASTGAAAALSAAAALRCEHHLAVAPGATHLFEEPGTLMTAAALARDWFLAHLRSDVTAGPVRQSIS